MMDGLKISGKSIPKTAPPKMSVVTNIVICSFTHIGRVSYIANCKQNGWNWNKKLNLNVCQGSNIIAANMTADTAPLAPSAQ